VKISRKGFIGAIGDDLPSLIPIVFALLIFFTVFTTTLNVYNSANSNVATEMGMLSVARTLKGDSLMLNVTQFQKRCDDVRIQSYPHNFMVAVYKADKDLDTVIEDFSEPDIDVSYSENFLTQDVGGSKETYFCGYRKIGAKNFGEVGAGNQAREEYILRYYPIAIQTELTIDGKDYYVIIPGIMAMIVW
jgi:hypothetical protein